MVRLQPKFYQINGDCCVGYSYKNLFNIGLSCDFNEDQKKKLQEKLGAMQRDLNNHE
jgi:hypothetical protein